MKGAGACHQAFFLVAAHRFFCAAAILARASGLNIRFLGEEFCEIFVRVESGEIFLGRPGLRLTTGAIPARALRACWSRAISESISARIEDMYIQEV